jgi:hypothetical protein
MEARVRCLPKHATFCKVFIIIVFISEIDYFYLQTLIIAMFSAFTPIIITAPCLL